MDSGRSEYEEKSDGESDLRVRQRSDKDGASIVSASNVNAADEKRSDLAFEVYLRFGTDRRLAGQIPTVSGDGVGHILVVITWGSIPLGYLVRLGEEIRRI